MLPKLARKYEAITASLGLYIYKSKGIGEIFRKVSPAFESVTSSVSLECVLFGHLESVTVCLARRFLKTR